MGCSKTVTRNVCPLTWSGLPPPHSSPSRWSRGSRRWRGRPGCWWWTAGRMRSCAASASRPPRRWPCAWPVLPSPCPTPTSSSPPASPLTPGSTPGGKKRENGSVPKQGQVTKPRRSASRAAKKVTVGLFLLWFSGSHFPGSF